MRKTIGHPLPPTDPSESGPLSFLPLLDPLEIGLGQTMLRLEP